MKTTSIVLLGLVSTVSIPAFAVDGSIGDASAVLQVEEGMEMADGIAGRQAMHYTTGSRSHFVPTAAAGSEERPTDNTDRSPTYEEQSLDDWR